MLTAAFSPNQATARTTGVVLGVDSTHLGPVPMTIAHILQGCFSEGAFGHSVLADPAGHPQGHGARRNLGVVRHERRCPDERAATDYHTVEHH